jgi:hypothetical protein
MREVGGPPATGKHGAARGCVLTLCGVVMHGVLSDGGHAGRRMAGCGTKCLFSRTPRCVTRTSGDCSEVACKWL